MNHSRTLVFPGISWYLAALPAALIVYFALRENVVEIEPPIPAQNAPAYDSAWRQYRHLSTNVKKAWIGLVLAIAFVMAPNISPGSIKSPSIHSIMIILGVILVLLAWAVMIHFQFQLVRWPCPRCGRAFRGLWPFPFLGSHCRYCRLPRWGKFQDRKL